MSLAPRVAGVEYEVDHAVIDGRGYFLFTHNGPGPTGRNRRTADRHRPGVRPVGPVDVHRPRSGSANRGHPGLRGLPRPELSVAGTTTGGYRRPAPHRRNPDRRRFRRGPLSASRCAQPGPRATRSGRRRACAWATPASSSPPNCWNSTSPRVSAPCSSGRSSSGATTPTTTSSRANGSPSTTGPASRCPS